MKAKIENLEKKINTVKQQRDIWESDAKYVKEQLKQSEEQRHEAQAMAASSQKEMATLKSGKAELRKELEAQDKLLKWEVGARKESERMGNATTKELRRLRAFKAQFVNLASTLKDTEGT
jgi:septal ring factor EnvC (AmiA/AmiB activator)